jgi:hypothetical protein
MRSSPFLLATAIVEIVAGLSMLALPENSLSLLFGVDAVATELQIVSWWVGVALLAIGVASAMARHDGRGLALRGLLVGILIYDVGAAALLAYTGVGMQLAGPALWPAVALHTALAIWCVLCLRAEFAP